MRILMLNNEFPPLGGGTGTVNQAILQRLALQPDLYIDLITSAAGDRAQEEWFSERIQIFKLPVGRWNIHHASNRELITYASKALVLGWRLYRQHPYDLCFAWSAVPAGGAAMALRYLCGLRYFVRVCGPDIPGFEQRYGFLYPVLTPVIQLIWRNAQVVVAKCQGEADMIRAVDKKVKIKLIPNGVDIESFEIVKSQSDEGVLRLLCAGRLIERKGQRHLIEALKRLVDEGWDISLDLVGEGDAQASYQDLVEQLGLANRVRFCGYVAREEIPRHYSAADVFVLPSYNEGMSVATLEAMAAGLPVVITRTGGTVELVLEGVNGYSFSWADVDTLVDILRRFAQDPSLARKMGHASRERATQFTWEAPAREYLELFQLLSI